MIRRLLTILAAAAAMTTALAAPSASAAGTSANFWIHCNFTGISRTIDPVVDPGSTTTMHFHDFYGNTGISENSTPASLQANPSSTCTTSTDTAAYWAPTLLLNPGEVQDQSPAGFACAADTNPSFTGYQVCHYTNIRAYYGNSGASGSTPGYQVNPAGQETVGGNADATGVQPVTQISWACGGSSPFEPYPYDCEGIGGDHNYIDLSSDQDGVIMRVIMPRCWNGLDPANRANFAYPTGGIDSVACPTGFTGHLLPFINLRFHTGIYDPCRSSTGIALPCPAGTTNAPAFGFELADGSQMPWYQAHGDFMNGWQYAPTAGGLDDLEQDCLISTLACPANPHTSPASNMPT